LEEVAPPGAACAKTAGAEAMASKIMRKVFFMGEKK